jgi:MEMO1 family protein
MIRSPAVAGRFYPSDARELAAEVDLFAPADTPKLPALGCLVPHAGYMYSGHVAGEVYASLQIPSRCILFGPRHFPRGQSTAILTEGAWQTPFGEAPIDCALASKLARAAPLLREDPIAHEREHSLEVQIPFLQRLVPDLRFVPVVLATDRYPVLEELGQAVAKVILSEREHILIIASSDMNHYENDALTREKDKKAIDRILALDARGLYDTVRNESISMCGYAATVTALVALVQLGTKQAKLIRYATSGDVTGDRNEVVGYAGITFS